MLRTWIGEENLDTRIEITQAVGADNVFTEEFIITCLVPYPPNIFSLGYHQSYD